MKMSGEIGWRTMPLAVVLILGAATPAAAATLKVAVYGSDSASCGWESPCRTISQAMENAASGDTILVGPGHYGDVSGNGEFTGPGDEHADPNAGSVNGVPNPGCVVCITKPLHIYSRQGAATTIIANHSQSPYGSTVMISSPGVEFGALGAGFTLIGSSNAGVTIALRFPILQNVTAAGNIDVGDTQGFAYFGYSFFVPCSVPPDPMGPDCRAPARVLIANNQAFGNQAGFSVIVNNAYVKPASILVKDNMALGAGTGFFVSPGPGAGGSEKVVYSAADVQLVGNIANGGGVGFVASGSGQITYNTAVKNSQMGFEVTPGGAAFYGNSAIGNGGPGVVVNLSQNSGPPSFLPELTPNMFVPFAGNNFIGNDRNRPALSLGPGGINAGPSAHCGVLMGIFLPAGFPVGPKPPSVINLAAANNYWGSADGPSSGGANADAVGGPCNLDGTTTIAQPFSTKPFTVRSNP
jgi:hypothetical protein